MDAHQRKIELQAPADLTYILDNIKNAARKKLDLHIPPSAAPQNEEDAFRTKVESLVQQYIQQTLALALPSVTVNGLDASPSLLAPPSTDGPADPSAPLDPNDPSYEPYDAALAEKLRNLYAALETETTKVAELRREVPAKAAQAYAERLAKEVGGLDAEMEEARRRARQVGQKRGELQGVKIERAERVGETWDKAKTGLEELRGITEGVARLEEAKKVVVEIERL